MNGLMHNATFWITIANLLYLASYSVHDILWLRILSVLAMLLLIPYYAMQPTPLMAPIAWNALFIAINVYWIVRLMIERRPVHFTPDEARLKDLAFPSLTPQEARDLFALGVWDDIATGTSVVQHDTRSNRFSLIARGIAAVVHRNITVDELSEGQFIGAFDKNADALDFDVVVREPVRVMCWPRTQLEAFLKKRPDVELILYRTVGFEVRRTLNDALAKLGRAAT